MRFFLLLAALSFFSVSAAADYKSEYKAYMAAIDAGDHAKALEHGEAAWRQAEGEIGDESTTAILAYNFARLAYDVAPASALAAFERATAITAQGKGPLSGPELSLTIADLKLRLDFENQARADALEDILKKEGDGVEALTTARAWRTLASAKLGTSDLLQSRNAADRAIERASQIQPREDRLLAESLIVGAIARLAKHERTERDIVEAVALFGEAFPLFPPQADIDHFDPLLARALSWRHSIWALIQSDEMKPVIDRIYGSETRIPTGEDLESAYKRAAGKENPGDWFRFAAPHPAGCDIEIRWLERKPPKYPRQALRKLNVGSILIGYDLNETGVERAVILADFPESGFGEAVVESMKEWRLAKPAAEECRKNHATHFAFIVR